MDFSPVQLVMVVILVIGVFTWRASRHRPPRPPVAPSETPVQVLERRLAAGEITAEEFDRLRARITSPPR
ncbi:MAG: SHOCT domain-containing protein [Thermoleophilia bacterium]